VPRGERLPDDFGFDDFLAALDAIDAPADEDLPTDDHGCVEVVTLPLAEVPSTVARLREAGIDPHLDMPGEGEVREGETTASVFVPRERLALARRVLGIEV
jgi:hypothetical protein